MKIRIVANAHAMGGGELSVLYLADMLVRRGHEVILNPTKHVNNQLTIPAGVQLGRPYMKATMGKVDLLLWYANDMVYKLKDKQDWWLRAFTSAKHTVAVLNFTMGEAQQEWIASRLSAVMFLNTTKEDEYCRKATGFKGTTISLAPPVNMSDLRNVKHNYETPIRAVKHGRFNGKYDQNDMTYIMGRAWHFDSSTEFSFMAAPPWLRDIANGDPRVHAYTWNEIPIKDLLAWGNVYWYPLPKNLRDQGPRVIVEAMAAGLDCIVDDRDGPHDRVTSETGWLCDSRDDYVNAFRSILEQPTQLVTKGHNARIRAYEEFRPERWIEFLEATVK